MSVSHLNFSGVFEMLVMFFQTCGALSLCLHRLTPYRSAWYGLGRIGVILSLFGLGISGALCGRHHSEFAIFAGGTMTLILIGMTMGNSNIDAVSPTRNLVEPKAA
ncbi:hypothetical protein [Planctomyces sp. SH-PL62]|uniref:hypothetical protein n=1 Tax=Planctomyces sp. SH-PL62 TaxID=1636152 RepID=UPI00078C2B82|nr:hypothetical protein [Planctomyces sp. SH-PL62]AMV38959.1 hypothetical protein VT85_16100 [Planctomyces sp. SH-PL62]